MKTSLTRILSIAVLATLGGFATAEPTTVKSSKSNSSDRTAATKPTLVTGTVTRVDLKKRTYTVTANGKEYQFTFPKGETPPVVGAQKTNLNASRSNVN